MDPPVSIVLPVYNGANTVRPVIESVLAQTHATLELVISDNASTDGTEEICRHFERQDERVTYHRNRSNIGLHNNFTRAAQMASGKYLRWIGDDDWLDPSYVARTLAAFVDDPEPVLVTTQIVYLGLDGVETLNAHYDPSALSSPDPIERFAEMLRLLTGDFAALDPLYGLMRRDVALMPRRNMFREDEVFAARLALAGRWGHVAAPLARRGRPVDSAAALVRSLGIPSWRWHIRAAEQYRELSHWISESRLDPAQRRRAREEITKMYVRRKKLRISRGFAKARDRAATTVRHSSSVRATS
jgi:glycosyltransferase involved in cell wall biosynthesis